MPNPTFHVQQIDAARYAAVPTLLIQLRIEEEDGGGIEAITLNTQIRIAASQRSYNRDEQARLMELFGPAADWGRTLKSLLWTQSVMPVPAFTGQTVVALPVTCTYDFEVVSAKYFHGVADGAIPLELFFSGAMFFRDPQGSLQIAPIPWDKEARCRLPISLWKDLMEAYFPRSAWLRLQRDTFERLYRYRSEKGWPTWEAALEALMRARSAQVPQ